MRERSAARRQSRPLLAQVLPHLRAGLPRLYPHRGVAGVIGNVAALLLFGLLGSALLHLAAYHLRADAQATYLLEHCPWRPVVLAVLVATLANALLFQRELVALWRERHRLAAQIGLRAVEDAAHLSPRGLARLLGIFLCLYLSGSVGTALAQHLAPMQAPMSMGGQRMLMPVNPLIPLPVAQPLLAGLLALLLWRCERRADSLRRIVARLRRMVALLVATSAPVPRPTNQEGRALRRLFGYAIFSRPPPARLQHA